jgi:enamine deaminase RidA (YjgF/YER057c/UK114 family)
MSKTTITSPELAPPVGPFSQAVEAGGFIYFSGQVGQGRQAPPWKPGAELF